jgi:hypothetical protein
MDVQSRRNVVIVEILVAMIFFCKSTPHGTLVLAKIYGLGNQIQDRLFIFETLLFPLFINRGLPFLQIIQWKQPDIKCNSLIPAYT